MNLVVNNPNFSIVMPDGCNAKCSFCFWKKKCKADNFYTKLEQTLIDLPDVFQQISITGGEPTVNISSLVKVLEIIQRVKKQRPFKVVLTSNGHKLYNLVKDYPRELVKVINHLNISRHCVNDIANYKAFDTFTLPDMRQLSYTMYMFQSRFIDVTFSAVLDERFFYEKKDIEDYIHFAHRYGANAVSLRLPFGSLDTHKLEAEFLGIDSQTHSCPVCRHTTQYIDGMLVTWKASSGEPSKQMNGIYELIYHEDATLTADWEGKLKVELED